MQILERPALLISLTTIVMLGTSPAQSSFLEVRRAALEPATKIHTRWTSFVNTNHVSGIAVDGDQVWTVGGGVKRYDLKTNRYTVFCAEHGLASNDTRAIAIDNDFIWVATAGGVSRYSKKEGIWRNFYQGDGPADDMLVSIALDADSHKIWFGSWDSGIISYDIRKNNWESFSVKDGLSNNCVISLAFDPEKQTLWCGTWGGGLSQLDLKSGKWRSWDKTSKLPSNTVTAIAVDGDSIWLGTLSAGICRYHKRTDRWEHISRRKGLAGDDVSSIVVDDRSNSVWVGTKDGGVCRFRKDSGRWEKNSLLNGGLGTNITAIALADNKQLFLGTWGDGFIRYDYSNGRPQRFKTDNEIVHNRVVTMLADRANARLWFGTEGGGASSYEPTTDRWREFRASMKILPDDTVNEVAVALSENENLVWFGTVDGVVGVPDRRRPYTQKSPRLRRALRNALIESFAFDYKDKVLWSGTNNQGLYWYDLKTGIWHHVDNLPDHIFHSLAWDESEGVLWYGTETGVEGYDQRLRKRTIFESFPVTEIRSVVLDNKRDTLWAGSWNSGLFRCDKRTRRWTRYTKGDGLPGDTVVGIALDDRADGREALWVGTDMGVARYDLNTQQWQRFTTRDGLAHNFVLAVAVDDTGSVWFGTWGGGASRYETK